MKTAILVILICLGWSVPAAASQESAPRIAAVDEAIRPLLVEGHFPGAAVAVLRNGRPIHGGTYGVADAAHQVPVTTGTVFELASLTKQMTELAGCAIVDKVRVSPRLNFQLLRIF